MSATNHTPNLNLSQFIPLDKPAWLGDYNSDMSKIDTAVHKVQTQADSMETAVEQATTAAQAATQAAQAATEAAQNAADKAQDAETTANNVSGSATQALTIAQQAQEAVAGKVDKAGDTMTGTLKMGNGSQVQLVGSDGTVISQIAPFASSGQTGATFGLPGKNAAVTLLPNGTVKVGGSTPCQVKNVGDPTEDHDAATKAYVDANGGGGGVTGLYNDWTQATVPNRYGGNVLLGNVLFFSIACDGRNTSQFFDLTLPAGTSQKYKQGVCKGMGYIYCVTPSSGVNAVLNHLGAATFALSSADKITVNLKSVINTAPSLFSAFGFVVLESN